MRLLKDVLLSPLAVIVAGVLIAIVGVGYSEAFDDLTYAISYARGHVLIGLWTEAHASGAIAQATIRAAPELILLVQPGLNEPAVCHSERSEESLPPS